MKKILQPHNRSIRELAEKDGISMTNLYAWHKADWFEGRMLPQVADKLSWVVETAALKEAQLSIWCRERGLYTEQVRAWRQACE